MIPVYAFFVHYFTLTNRLKLALARRCAFDEMVVRKVWHDLRFASERTLAFASALDSAPAPLVDGFASQNWIRDLTSAQFQLAIAVHHCLQQRIDVGDKESTSGIGRTVAAMEEHDRLLLLSDESHEHLLSFSLDMTGLLVGFSAPVSIIATADRSFLLSQDTYKDGRAGLAEGLNCEFLPTLVDFVVALPPKEDGGIFDHWIRKKKLDTLIQLVPFSCLRFLSTHYF